MGRWWDGDGTVMGRWWDGAGTVMGVTIPCYIFPSFVTIWPITSAVYSDVKLNNNAWSIIVWNDLIYLPVFTSQEGYITITLQTGLMIANGVKSKIAKWEPASRVFPTVTNKSIIKSWIIRVTFFLVKHISLNINMYHILQKPKLWSNDDVF